MYVFWIQSLQLTGSIWDTVVDKCFVQGEIPVCWVLAVYSRCTQGSHGTFQIKASARYITTLYCFHYIPGLQHGFEDRDSNP
jgi:hypothetical protein